MDGMPVVSRVEQDESIQGFALTDPKADGDWMNFGYAGTGEWPIKIGNYSGGDAHPLKVFDVDQRKSGA